MNPIIPENSILFRNVSEEHRKRIMKELLYSIQSYEKGETIFHMLDPALRGGMLLKGSLMTRKSLPSGCQVDIKTLVPGELFGLAAVFSEKSYYPCDLLAVSPSTVMLFSKEELLALMEMDTNILKNVMEEMASYVHLLQKRVELFSYSGIAQRIACYLLTELKQSGSSVRIPGSVSRWALILNVSRTSLHRELRKLEEKGILRYQPPFIEVLREHELQNVMDGSGEAAI